MHKNILAVIIISLAMMGCENRISLDLKSTEPRIVIEGIISDRPGESMFLISKTTDYFNSNLFPPVSGAQIIISVNNNNVDTVQESWPGVYYVHGFRGAVGRTYSATVTVEGKTYTASAYMPPATSIDFFNTVYQSGGGLGPNTDEGYLLYIWFQDHSYMDDYCRLRVLVNGMLAPEYELYSDKYSNGEFICYEYGRAFSAWDTLQVDLLSMDKAVYEYFWTLTNAVAWEDGTDPQVAPANPNTNWSGDALGYFGAFSTSRLVIVVRP